MNPINDKYLSNKRILVTGSSGFLGTHLISHLRYMGLKIEHEDDNPNVLTPRSSDYDLTDQSQVKSLFKELKPEIVIHLAAVVGGIGANRDNPGSFYYKNMSMGLHLMEEARLNNINKFVAIGTICAYPKFASIPFKEEDLWNGYPEETNAPYGLAKKMMLVQSQAYRQQYGFNSIYLLPVNLYGPHDNFDLHTSHVIPALIRKMIEAKESNSESVTLWGTGSASREFLYASDAAQGIIAATCKYNKSDPINLGVGQEITIKNLAEKLQGICNFKGKIIWDDSKPDGQPRRCLDTTKAVSEFGWSASTGLDEGLTRTVEWYLTCDPNKCRSPKPLRQL